MVLNGGFDVSVNGQATNVRSSAIWSSDVKFRAKENPERTTGRALPPLKSESVSNRATPNASEIQPQGQLLARSSQQCTL
jgi:hypothetical protein